MSAPATAAGLDCTAIRQILCDPSECSAANDPITSVIIDIDGFAIEWCRLDECFQAPALISTASGYTHIVATSTPRVADTVLINYWPAARMLVMTAHVESVAVVTWAQCVAY